MGGSSPHRRRTAPARRAGATRDTRDAPSSKPPIPAAPLLIESTPPVTGLYLVAGLTAYIAGRQLLFPLRGIPRITNWGRGTGLVIAVALLAATATLIGVGAA